MATDPIFPLGEGTAMRELLRTIREDRWIVYSEGPDHLGAQPACLSPDPVRDGLRRHRELFISLLKDEAELTETDRKRILAADVRMGFQAPGDWQGAARELRERGGII